MKKILIVDDNDEFRTSLRDLLESSSYRVEEAKNGNHALKLLDSARFDLVITDILMPDRDGLELIHSIATENFGSKVIVMTGGGQIDAEQYLRMASLYPTVNAELKKPFKPNLLLETVEKLIG